MSGLPTITFHVSFFYYCCCPFSCLISLILTCFVNIVCSCLFVNHRTLILGYTTGYSRIYSQCHPWKDSGIHRVLLGIRLLWCFSISSSIIATCCTCKTNNCRCSFHQISQEYVEEFLPAIFLAILDKFLQNLLQ